MIKTISSTKPISSKDIKDIAQGCTVELEKSVVNSTSKSNAFIRKIVRKGTVTYGVNTGFGSFKDIAIDKTQTEELQINLIRSHACGVGRELDIEEVRAVMAIRLVSLSKGFSGVRLELVEQVRDLLNKHVTPSVPSQGSVGASGDLAPLCHIGLVLAGEGTAYFNGKKLKGGQALKLAKIKPLTFQAKEGLAWSNGTSVMTGLASLVVEDANNILNWAEMACALSFEALRGCAAALDEKVHMVRNQKGQIDSASALRELLKGSKLVNSDLKRVQDSYTLRCSPQVHGACRDAIHHVTNIVTNEINAVTDNPLIFSNVEEVISGGNFHGEPIAINMDYIAIALSELANISERRTAKLIDPATSHGLPPFLITKEKAGLCSGLMIPQYVAAALVSENKVLAHPASVDSIPTSANQEDHVSMGTIAARKAREVVKNVYNVLAIEILNACQAIDFVGPEKLAPQTKTVYEKVRKISKFVDQDRSLTVDIENIVKLMKEV